MFYNRFVYTKINFDMLLSVKIKKIVIKDKTNFPLENENLSVDFGDTGYGVCIDNKTAIKLTREKKENWSK